MAVLRRYGQGVLGDLLLDIVQGILHRAHFRDYSVVAALLELH